ncbi:MAG: hypothetical protein K2O28_01690 [Clostridia bacterium]|nr:hypothetical protein [Clostridia bacterium]
MKDYNLIRYLAKMAGAKPKRDKTALFCYFPFGSNNLITALITFSHKTSTGVFFDLTSVYEAYGKKYGSYEDFISTLTEKYAFFDSTVLGGKAYVVSDLRQNRIDHVASQALTSVTVMINCLNEMFGTSCPSFSEETWRDFHREYLAKQSRNSCLFGWAGVVAFVLCVVWFIVAGSGNNVFLFLLSIPAAVACLIAFIVFFIRRRHFKNQLGKSLRSKRR